MKAQRSKPNLVAAKVESENLSRKRVPFQQLSSRDLLDFPELSEEDLHILFTGSYQFKQAVSYLAEVLDENDELLVKYYKDSTPNNKLVQFCVQSRHKNRTMWKCYIEYESNLNTVDGILGYCCECPNGNRTVGCCAHVTAVIYYLSNLRFQSKIPQPAKILTHLFDQDEIEPVIGSDLDDE